MKNKLKTIIGIILFYIIISNFLVCSHAFSIESANIKREHVVEHHLRYWNEELNDWYYAGATLVNYIASDGNKYPAYCMNKELPGVGVTNGEYENYDVIATELISNNQIWRVVKNGYPYKSPQQMGVDTEDDAFLATKQAVYCILYNIDPCTYFISSDDIERGASDERGDKIKNAIVDLVNNGKNGTESYEKGTYTITKTEAKEDNIDKNFISSIYTLNSKFNVKDFTVYFLEEIPTGTIVTDLNNIEKTSFKQGEKFKILVPKTSLGTVWNDDGINWSSNSINFNIKVKANLKTYPILYAETTIPGTQNYVLTGNPFEEEESNINFNYITNGGELKVKKISSDENFWNDNKKGYAVPNAKYELRRLDTNKIIKVLTTNNKGEFNITGLPAGEYSLKEIETPEFYIKDENTYKFKITKELEIVNFNLENAPVICGFFNIEKTSNCYNQVVNTDNNKLLPGAKYEIRDEYGKFIYSGITNEDGKFLEDLKLLPGNYKIFETEAPEGYVLDKTIYKFTIPKVNGEKLILKLKNDVLEYEKKEIEEPKIEKEISRPKLPKTGF